MRTGFDAVLLAGFGGPESADEVLPFLERVTAGRGIPPERLLEVGRHYLTLGGVSPINEQNRQLTAALQAELDRRDLGLPVILGNRNSAPFLADAVADLHQSGQHRVLAIATSAYSSYSGCRQYREDLAGALAATGLAGELTITKVRPYGYLPGFVAAMADGLRDALAQAAASGDGPHVFFTTHSIPDTMAAAAGPGGTGAYVAQHLDVAQRILAGAAEAKGAGPAWSLVYQSRSVILVPIGFISDHIEVVWDLDTQARQTAEELGLAFHRVPTAGCDQRFVAGLADLVENAVNGVSLDPTPPWGGTCSTDCCVSTRSTKDVAPAC
jgi:ferrochelatase